MSATLVVKPGDEPGSLELVSVWPGRRATSDPDARLTTTLTVSPQFAADLERRIATARQRRGRWRKVWCLVVGGAFGLAAIDNVLGNGESRWTSAAACAAAAWHMFGVAERWRWRS